MQRSVGGQYRGDRCVEIGPGGIGEVDRHHADNAVAPISKSYVLPDNRSIAPELALPEVVGEHHDCGRPGRPIGRLQNAAHRRPFGQDPKVLIGHIGPNQSLGTRPGPQDRAKSPCERHRLKGIGTGSPT